MTKCQDCKSESNGYLYCKKCEVVMKANKLREEIILGAAEDLQDQLLKYPDDVIIKAKTRTVRIKLRII